MKRKYSTPYLVVESFQLDTSIASCSSEGGIPLHFAWNTCKLEGSEYFGIEEVCEVDVYHETEPGDKICYNSPVEGLVFINS